MSEIRLWWLRRFWLRRPTLRLAGAGWIGHGVRLVRRYWLTILLFLSAALLIWCLVDLLVSGDQKAPDPTGKEITNTAALLLGILLVTWVLKARQKLVINEFVDHREVEKKDEAETATTDGKQPEATTSGLAVLLAMELGKMARLFRTVDEQRAVATAVTDQTRPLAAGPVADLGERLFQDAVSAEHKLSVGPLTIPVGAVLGLAGRLAQGPRIAGHVYGDETSLILTARMGGRGGPYAWRVSRQRKGGTLLADMTAAVQELACRMFADLALDGGVRWQAAASFAKGLDAYRDSLSTPHAKRSKLRDAERHFIRAASEDQRFDRTHHNLGVVYLERHWIPDRAQALRPAEQSFRLAIAKSSGNRLESYYGLALTRLEANLLLDDPQNPRPELESGYRLVAEHCQRVIAGRPPLLLKASAYDLRGAAGLAAELCAGRGRTRRPIRSRRRAVSLALGARLRVLLAGRATGATEPSLLAAVRSLGGLGGEHSSRIDGARNGWSRAYHSWRAEVAFRRAIALDRSRAELCFELGTLAITRGSIMRAHVAFRAAVELEPDRLKYRAWMAYALAARGQDAAARAACALALADPAAAVPPSEDPLVIVELAYRRLGDEDEADRVEGMRPLLAAIGGEAQLLAMPEEHDAARDRLRKQFDQHSSAGRDWEAAQVAVTLALADPQVAPTEAVVDLLKAIEALERSHPEELKRRGLRGELAQKLFAAEFRAEALEEAERAVSLDPVSPFERSVVSNLYLEMNQFDAARDALELALLTSPESPDLHWGLGRVYLLQALNRAESTERLDLARLARDHLGQAFELSESAPADPARSRLRAQALSLRGEIRESTGEADAAIGDFRVASALETQNLLRRIRVADALLRNKSYDEARFAYQAVLDDPRVDPGKDLTEELQRDDDELPVTRAEIVLLTYYGLARTYGDRDAGVDDALELLERALTALRDVPPERDALRGLEARVLAHKGWLLCKEQRIDDGLPLLEHSVSLRANAEAYALLGRAYLAKRERVAEADRAVWVARAHTSAAHAEATDTWGDEREARAALDAELDALQAA